MSKYLTKVDPTHYECRTIGHAWTYDDVVKKGSDFVQSLRCLRCTSHKIVHLDRNGDVKGRGYHYVAGYLLGAGHLDDDDRRRLRLRTAKSHIATTTPKAED